MCIASIVTSLEMACLRRAFTSGSLVVLDASSRASLIKLPLFASTSITPFRLDTHLGFSPAFNCLHLLFGSGFFPGFFSLDAAFLDFFVAAVETGFSVAFLLPNAAAVIFLDRTTRSWKESDVLQSSIEQVGVSDLVSMEGMSMEGKDDATSAEEMGRRRIPGTFDRDPRQTASLLNSLQKHLFLLPRPVHSVL